MHESYQLFKYDTCPFCLRVRRFLEEFPELDVTLRDIYNEPGAMRELVQGGGRTTVRALLEAVAARLGVEPRCELAPVRPGEVMHSTASIEAARALIGYEPVVALETGLDRTVAYYAEEREGR